MTSYELYVEIRKRLSMLTYLKNIPEHELDFYYSQSNECINRNAEFDGLLYKESQGIQFAFYKMLYNASLEKPRLSAIVNFDKNFAFLKQFTRWFNPRVYLERYSGQDVVEKTWEDLHYNGFCGFILSLKGDGQLVRQFSQTMVIGAKYLSDFSCLDELIADIKAHSTTREELISYFVNKGFSVDFSCRFLNDICPSLDIPVMCPQIRKIMIIKNKRTKNFYNSNSGKIQLIKDAASTLEEINIELASQGKKRITLCAFERMIYLSKNGNFYLHKNTAKNSAL